MQAHLPVNDYHKWGIVLWKVPEAHVHGLLAGGSTSKWAARGTPSWTGWVIPFQRRDQTRLPWNCFNPIFKLELTSFLCALQAKKGGKKKKSALAFYNRTEVTFRTAGFFSRPVRLCFIWVEHVCLCRTRFSATTDRLCVCFHLKSVLNCAIFFVCIPSLF